MFLLLIFIIPIIIPVIIARFIYLFISSRIKNINIKTAHAILIILALFSLHYSMQIYSFWVTPASAALGFVLPFLIPYAVIIVISSIFNLSVISLIYKNLKQNLNIVSKILFIIYTLIYSIPLLFLLITVISFILAIF